MSPPTEIIHIGVNRWDSLMQREQHLMLGLSRFYRILFIDPPLSFLTLSLGKLQKKGWTFGSRLRRVNDHLLVYTPPAFPPFSQNSSMIHRWNTYLLTSRMKHLIRKLSFSHFVLGLSWPLWVSVFKELRPRWSYYDCSDDYLTYPGLKASRERVKHSEEDLLRSVNLVFCSAQKLKEEKSLLNPNCFFVPNGVEGSLLQSMSMEKDLPLDLRSIRRPILGFMGTLGSWLDFDTLAGLARARPDWSIVMVGPVASKQVASGRRGIPNLHWLGEKSYKEVPLYLKGFDVCLIPFTVNEFTEKVYPTKFHQYLGAGKPVISSPLPDLLAFKPWVTFYGNLKEMESAIDRVLREDTPEKARERMRIAAENTWDQRVKTVVEIFNRHLK